MMANIRKVILPKVIQYLSLSAIDVKLLLVALAPTGKSKQSLKSLGTIHFVPILV